MYLQKNVQFNGMNRQQFIRIVSVWYMMIYRVVEYSRKQYIIMNIHLKELLYMYTYTHLMTWNKNKIIRKFAINAQCMSVLYICYVHIITIIAKVKKINNNNTSEMKPASPTAIWSIDQLLNRTDAKTSRNRFLAAYVQGSGIPNVLLAMWPLDDRHFSHYSMSAVAVAVVRCILICCLLCGNDFHIFSVMQYNLLHCKRAVVDFPANSKKKNKHRKIFINFTFRLDNNQTAANYYLCRYILSIYRKLSFKNSRII